MGLCKTGLCKTGLCKVGLCKPLVCVLALEADVSGLAVWLSRIAEPVTGRIILGKTDTADSAPGPGPEKKTENGVLFASGNPFPDSVAVDNSAAIVYSGAP